MKQIAPLLVIVGCMIILVLGVNYQIDRVGNQIKTDIKTIDSLQTELHISQTNVGRYEIFYEIMKERHPKESEGIMDSIE